MTSRALSPARSRAAFRVARARVGSRLQLTSRVVVVFVAFVFVGGSAHAQDPTGAIEGAVTDRTAGALAGARVTAINLETGFTKETATASDGFYRLLLLPVGQYTMTVEAARFATLVREAIQVNVGQTVRVNAQLELPTLSRDGDGLWRSAAGGYHDQRARPCRDRPRARRPAAQRAQFHAARSAADRCGAADGRRRDGGRQPSAGPGVCRERHAPGIEHVPGGRRAERQPHGWRLRAQASRRGDCRVPHPDAERAARSMAALAGPRRAS